MTKILFACFFVLATLCFGQSNTEKITLSLTGETSKEAIQLIENSSNYQFYYLEEWLDSTPFNENFINLSIQEVLAILFNKTDVQYFFYKEGKIILTKGRIIHDYLPDNFFPISTKSDSLYNKKTDVKALSVQFKKSELNERNLRQTIIIGKQQKQSFSPTFLLTGILRNVETNKPLANVVVSSSNMERTVTDDEGYYEIELPYGANTLFIDALGVERLEQPILLYSKGELNLNLSDNIEELDEVVLTADSRKTITETTMGNNTLESEDSKTIPVVLGERDLLKIATTLPGITTAGEASAGFNVRGGKEDQNLILLDNSVLYNSSHFFGIFNALNPFSIESVDIYKGNIPAEYGGRLSSVFSINTKKVNTEKISGEASIGPVTGNIVFEMPIIKKKSGVMVGARGTYSDWILNSFDQEAFEGRSASFYDLIVKYDHEINEKNTISATGYYSKDAFSITKDSLYEYQNKVASLEWNHVINEKLSGNLKLSHSDYFFEIGFDGRPEIDYIFDFGINETQLKYKLRYKLNSSHSITYGISSKIYKSSPGSIRGKSAQSQIERISLPIEKGLESAIFISDEWTFSEKFKLDAGLRFSIFNAIGPAEQIIYDENLPRSPDSAIESQTFEKSEFYKTYTNPEFRFGARYSFTPDFSVKTSISSAVQYIHSLSNNTTVSPIDTWKLSDTNIEPQRAIIFSLGFYKFFDVDNYEISLEGFYKNLDNILDFKVGAQLLLNEAVEQETLQGDGKSYGGELLIKKNNGKLTGWIGYTYSRALYRLKSNFTEEQVNNGNFFPANFDKPHDFSLVSNYDITKRLNFSANFTYQTGRPVTLPTGTFFFDGQQQVLFSARNQFRIPDYYRLDLGFNLEGNHKTKKLAHSFWSLSIYNVLGRNNPYSVFFVTEEGQVKAFQSSIFNIPIPSITYNLKF